MQFSKKIMIATSVVFVVTVIFSMIYCFASDGIDTSIVITLLSSTGAVFGSSCAFYFKKSELENLYKIKRSFLGEKYGILKDIGVLDGNRAISEIENEIGVIDTCIDMKETSINEVGVTESIADNIINNIQ